MYEGITFALSPIDADHEGFGSLSRVIIEVTDVDTQCVASAQSLRTCTAD